MTIIRLQVRHDIKANWETYNPVLFAGELGVETDSPYSPRLKVGDGTTNWNNLPFLDERAIDRYADEAILGNKSFSEKLTLDKGAVIPSGYTLEGTAQNAIRDNIGNVIDTYYQRNLIISDEIDENTDWNALTLEGIYKVNMDVWGAPSTLHGPNNFRTDLYSKGILFVMSNDNFIAQTYYPYQNSPVLMRHYNGETWTDWVTLSSGDTGVVHTTGDETIGGAKTFSDNITTSSGNLILDNVGDVTISKGDTVFIRKNSDNNVYISSNENGNIYLRPNGDNNEEGSIEINKQGVIQGKVTQDSEGNIITETYIQKSQIRQIAENEGLTATLLDRYLLENSEGYAKVEEMCHSTFDLSKFTVIGSPTISDDGVVSGFSTGNCLSINSNFNIPTADTWEIILPILTFKSVSQYIIGSDVQYSFTFAYTRNNRVAIYLSSNGTTWDIGTSISDKVFNLNTPYKFKLKFDGNSYSVYVLENDTWTSCIITNSSLKIFNFEQFTVGKYYTAYANNTGFDLKSFAIWVDGVPIFNGNKTGLDIIKPSDYEVVGSPTVTDDGVASGFSNTNYIKKSSITLSDTWEIKGNFRSFNTQTNTNRIIEGGNVSSNVTEGPILMVTASNNIIAWAFYQNGVNVVPTTVTSYAIDNNKDYYYILSYNGQSINLAISTDNSSYTDISTVPIVLTGDTTFNLLFGCSPNATERYLDGSIDLNAFKIYVNGNLTYQPCLKIPYNKTRSGIKVSDVYYKNRVDDCYEQYNTSNYFVIDEENKLYQIPYDTSDGHCVSLDNYRNGKNSYVFDSNLECVQTGPCTANTPVTLLIPYANEDYVISCPYSAKTRTGFTPTVTGDFISKGQIYLSDT